MKHQVTSFGMLVVYMRSLTDYITVILQNKKLQAVNFLYNVAKSYKSEGITCSPFLNKDGLLSKECACLM